jgi:hypothetical protein
MPNVAEKTTVAELKAAFAEKNITVTVADADGKAMGDSKYVGTGCVVTDEMGYSYAVVVLGDVDGNGFIDSTDYLRIKSKFLGTFVIEGIYLKAADVFQDGELTSTDYLKIKSHFLGALNIFE